MSTEASALAQTLVQHSEEDVLQALELYDSFYPHARQQLLQQYEREPLKRFTGEILSFNPDKHFGFIRAPPEAELDKDVFCSSNEMGHFQVGESVTFTLIFNKNQQPQARLLQGPDGSVPQFKGYGYDDSGPPLKLMRTEQPKAAYSGQTIRVAPPPPRPTTGQAIKVVISPPPPPASAGKGKVVNRPPAGPPPSSAGGRMLVNPPPRAAMAPLNPPMVATPPAPCPPQHLLQQQQQQQQQMTSRMAGTILSFVPEKNYGFISSQAAMATFGKDVFVSSAEIGSFSIGEAVFFDVVQNAKGQPQARNLEACSLTLPANGQEDPNRYVGSITSYNADKFFGFIACPEAMAVYGKDVFVSSYEIADCKVKDTVSFRVVLNQGGKPQARDLAPEAEDLVAALNL